MKTARAADGTTIAYEVFGQPQGETVLMLQGLGADSRGWTLQRMAFGRRFRCIAVDNRGVGGSAGALLPYSLEQMSTDAVTVLDHAGIDSAHVMGASMGGVIAQLLAVNHPERVRSLVLACTSCRHHDWRRELFEEWAAAVEQRGMSALSSDGLRWLIGPRLHRRLGMWLNLMARILLQATPEAFIAQVRAILEASDDLRFELGRIDVPTLVITGSQDLLTPFGDAEELAELISTARLAELRGAGHALMVEQPSTFNAAVLRFLVEAVAPLSAAS